MSSEDQNGETTKRDCRKRYSKEFRANAVKMVTELGLTNEKVAERLGCTTESVRRWVIAHRYELRPEQLQQELNVVEELRALKKENARLQMEIDFLKKAAAYFAKESK